MPEFEPRQDLGKNALHPINIIAKKAGEITKIMDFDRETEESLRRYGQLVYRAREIHKNFSGTTTVKTTYTFGKDEQGAKRELVITRDSYPTWINILKKQILDIQNAYLDTNPLTRMAQREILTFVQDLTPQDI